MINPDTYDKIAGWAQDKYAAQAPTLLGGSSTTTAAPAPGGMLSTTSAPGSAPAPVNWASATSAPAGPTAQPKAQAPVNVGNWYRNELGRDGDAAGVAYWQKALDGGMDAQEAYGMFQKSAAANKETVKPTAWAAANTYTGPQSVDGSTPVDDWGRNVLGRNLTAAEQANWNQRYNEAGASGGADGARALYSQFLQENAGGVKNQMDLNAASKISPNLIMAPAQIAKADLARRTIDPATETVRGQLGSLLAEDSPVLQQARADAMRTAADRGMLNSAMAASGGTDALIRSALNIATPDAGFYNRASDYNVAAENQATMWNAEQQNSFMQAQMQMESDTAARGQQMTLAQIQDATTRWSSEQTTANSAANRTAEEKANKKSLVNNIIANMDLSPDRKAAMLEQLGEGTAAVRDASGIKPGTGLAGAIYIIDSVQDDLIYGADSGKQGSDTVYGG